MAKRKRPDTTGKTDVIKSDTGTSVKSTASGKPNSPDAVRPEITTGDEADATAAEATLAFPIVGMGASAGGLEALTSFFKATPTHSGIAFVLVVHLDPKHVSIMPELLQKVTAMPVCQAENGMPVQRDRIYVIPPNKDLSILRGILYLMDQVQPRGANLPIDTFLRSLAQDQGRNAVCIILSGTGTDGTLGMKAVKGGEGLVMVQDERSAKYDGMPRSAIATGLVDYVLAPEEMPEQLVKYIRHTNGGVVPSIVPDEGPIPDVLQKIFIILRSRTNHDFSQYKKNTICRRIERRMSVHQIENITDYVSFAQKSEREADILFKELLIGVTNCFRDSEAFKVLQTTIMTKVFLDKPDGYAIRVWIPGCSTGEEAYSIAIVLHECMEQAGRHFQVNIFGTDLDEDAINLARTGLYPESVRADVGPERLKRYFSKEEGGQYRVKKSIREMLVFAPQNVIKDPPFTKVDLLCCRNLLIYLETELQRELLSIFHYSLKAKGILFLGTSESAGADAELFSASHKKWKIFHRKPPTSGSPSNLVFPTQPARKLHLEIPEAVRSAEELSALEMVQTILHQSDTPPCAIINDAGDTVYIHGQTGRYLEFAEGRASVSILDMARSGLRKELASAIRQATDKKQEITHKGLKVNYDGNWLRVDLTVRPIIGQTSTRGLLMVVFKENDTPKPNIRRRSTPGTGAVGDSSTEALELDLQYTKENLQTTIGELETSNEELKSINEELQSTNEELQSTNEELETSKEELQSLNEETVTVNAELQARMDELSNSNDDMKNLLDSTEIATIFLDLDLCVRRFTPKTSKIIPLTATDSGRPIRHLATSLVGVDIDECSQQVLGDLALREFEVVDRENRSYIMRIRPYRTSANVIDGVVITFEDTTSSRRIEEELRQRERIHGLALEAGKIGIFKVDLISGTGEWTPELSRIWGIPGNYTGSLTEFWWAHVHPEDLERVKAEHSRMTSSEEVGEMEFRVIRPNGETRWIRWRGPLRYPLAAAPGRSP
jgi:two-component system CheB/CheR fusion protein